MASAAAWRNRIVGTGDEPPADLLANPKNWRTHPPAQRDALRGSLTEVGWVQQVMVNRTTGFVVDGHARVEEAISRGEPTVPVLYVELTPEEEAVVLATLDPISAMASQDEERLRELLEEVRVDDAGLQALLDGLAQREASIGLTDPDYVPEVPPEPYVKAGEVWALDHHRLMCGDSTKAEDVGQLVMESVGALFTSPPYLYQRDYNGNMAADWQKLMVDVFAVAPVAADAQVFVNLGPVHRDGRVLRYWDGWIDEMEKGGWPLFGWYVWDKLNGLPGDWNGRLAPAHEFIFHFAIDHQQPIKTVKTKHVGKHSKSGMRRADGTVGPWCHAGRGVQPTKIADSVVRLSPQKGGVEGHVAPFPVALPKTFIEAYSAQSWLDPFAGSGTTIIAAEQLGRRCYAMEIDPRYAQVAIERWQAFTGKEAQRVE